MTAPIIGLIIISIGIRLGGNSPLKALEAIIQGSASSTYSISETLIRACPLLLSGLGVAMAFRAGIWNIGAEGQLYMGALVVTAFAGPAANLPNFIAIPFALLLAFIVAGFWAWIAALLRTRRGVQEVISTIMLNFLALQIVSWAVHGPLKESSGRSPYSNELPASLILARIVPGTRLHLGVLLALGCTIAVWFVLFRSIWGFQLRSVGKSVDASRHGGINPDRILWGTMFVSGGLAGLAGAVEIMGVTRLLFENFSPGYGYTAIAVALLGQLHPAGVLVSALVFGALQAGASAMQRDAGVDAVMVYVVQGIIILILGYQTAKKQAEPASSTNKLITQS